MKVRVLGLEWGPQVKQTALLASPIYIGQAQREGKKHIKRGAKKHIKRGASLLLSFGSAHAHSSRVYYSLFSLIKLNCKTGSSIGSHFCCGETDPRKLQIPPTFSSMNKNSDVGFTWTAIHQLPYPSLFPRVGSNSCPWVDDAIQPTYPLPPPYPPALNFSQNHGLFQEVGSLHQVAKVLELQLQHQSFHWLFRADFLQEWLVWSPCCPRDCQESYLASQCGSVNS